MLLDVYSVLFLFYLTTCVCVCHLFHGPLRECLRARGSLITAPPCVLVPAVLGALAVWIQNQNKTKKTLPGIALDPTSLSFLCPSRRWGRGEPEELAT